MLATCFDILHLALVTRGRLIRVNSQAPCRFGRIVICCVLFAAAPAVLAESKSCGDESLKQAEELLVEAMREHKLSYAAKGYKGGYSGSEPREHLQKHREECAKIEAAYKEKIDKALDKYEEALEPLLKKHKDAWEDFTALKSQRVVCARVPCDRFESGFMVWKFYSLGRLVMALDGCGWSTDEDGKSDAGMWNDRGRAYESNYAYDEATESYEKALAIFRKNWDRKGEATVLNNIAGIFLVSDPKRARQYYRESLNLSFRNGNPNLEAITLNNMGALCRSPKAKEYFDFVDCLKFHEASLKVCKSIGFREAELLNLEQITKIYSELKEKRLEQIRDSYSPGQKTDPEDEAFFKKQEEYEEQLEAIEKIMISDEMMRRLKDYGATVVVGSDTYTSIGDWFLRKIMGRETMTVTDEKDD